VNLCPDNAQGPACPDRFAREANRPGESKISVRPSIVRPDAATQRDSHCAALCERITRNAGLSRSPRAVEFSCTDTGKADAFA
jgi:hypothetical protein